MRFWSAPKRRIDEAAQYMALNQLALSPQCGFSSTVHGNDIAVQAQRDKLRLVFHMPGFLCAVGQATGVG